MSEAAHAAASVIFLDARRRAQIASSLTAFELAPGVLNTQIPSSAQRSTGILLTPAPALAIARSDSGISISCIDAERTTIARRLLPNVMSCILAERTMIASGFSGASEIAYLVLSKISVPTAEILFNV